MAIQCGIVGLPNVGKSTLFNALTKAEIDAANYPFCTIEPNIGVVTVPDPRLDALASIVKPQRVLPTTTEFVDIAGLVAGASKGEGLGNKFLAYIRETDAIAHVVRCFEDENVIHVNNTVDPLSDIEVIDTELLLADLEALDKAIAKLQKIARTGQKGIKEQLELLNALKAHLDAGNPARSFNNDEVLPLITPYNLLTMKPILFIANIDEDGEKDNPHYQKLVEFAQQQQGEVVAICASIEAEIAGLEPDEQKEFLESMGETEPGLNRVIRASYKLLHLRTYFTAGEKEVRAWTFPDGATAPQAAGVIHTDFEKGFIRAEIISYDDYVTYQGEQGSKDAGKWRLEGKEYLVQDGDVIHFRFNV